MHALSLPSLLLTQMQTSETAPNQTAWAIGNPAPSSDTASDEPQKFNDRHVSCLLPLFMSIKKWLSHQPGTATDGKSPTRSIMKKKGLNVAWLDFHEKHWFFG